MELDAYVEHLLGALEGGRSRAARGGRLRERRGVGARRRVRCCAAGARVDVLHAEPDGRNINADCGSTYPEQLQAAVRERGRRSRARARRRRGPRAWRSTRRGELVDGDQLMVMTALDWHERGMLRNDAIAVTVMSNLGLRRALADGRSRRSSRRRWATAT